jgi:hypothetical protein
MRFKSSKVNEFRLWGLVLMLAGMGFMIAGTAAIVFQFPGSAIITGFGLVLGLITMLGSMAIYFWAGMLSTSAVQLECPECGQVTKMLGKTDRCMYCRTILTLDPNEAHHPS